jgi:LAO/AO transport system kinase
VRRYVSPEWHNGRLPPWQFLRTTRAMANSIPTIDDYITGVRGHDRAMLGRAITLVESTKPAHRALARALLQALMPHTGNALRIGITGVPGVGKSTTIDQLGLNLIAAGHRVAVLAVDPTSKRSGGSILGDKTRMTRLSAEDDAFIRPSPTSGTLGGVTAKTRETMALVEAAGFDIVIVETVGVGQSEVAVADMVDFFLVLLLPGGGDDLQGIKKGIIELADMIAINKADGDNVSRATRAAADYANALHILTPRSASWQPPVITVSGAENRGLDVLWSHVERHRALMQKTGELSERRSSQAVGWMRDLIAERLLTSARSDPQVMAAWAGIEARVRGGTLLPAHAADAIIALMK